jgi:hypothetical protein
VEISVQLADGSRLNAVAPLTVPVILRVAVTIIVFGVRGPLNHAAVDRGRSGRRRAAHRDPTI